MPLFIEADEPLSSNTDWPSTVLMFPETGMKKERISSFRVLSDEPSGLTAGPLFSAAEESGDKAAIHTIRVIIDAIFFIIDVMYPLIDLGNVNTSLK
jgi:hypothetical protein